MKNTVLHTLILILLIMLPFSLGAVYAENESVMFDDSGSDYVVFTRDTLTENDTVLGVSGNEFKEYMTSNNIILYGYNKNTSFVFSVTCTETEFSKEVYDFSKMEDAAVLGLSKNLVNENAEIESVNGTKYLVTEGLNKTNGSVFVNIQYVTVVNGKLYVITNNIPENIFSTSSLVMADDIVNRFSVKQESDISEKKLIIILIIALIAFILVVVVIIIRSIIKDVKFNRNID